MNQIKVVMPDTLRTKLDLASEKSGKSIAEEIRTRLEASFERDVDVNKSTTNFLETVARTAVEIARETGRDWAEHAGSHEVLALAIQRWLEASKPKGPITFGNRPHATTFEADPRKLAELIVYRLQRQPDFTSSPMRQWMEEEHQRAKLSKDLEKHAAKQRRRGIPVSLLNEPLDEQRKSDQPKKGGKR